MAGSNWNSVFVLERGRLQWWRHQVSCVFENDRRSVDCWVWSLGTLSTVLLWWARILPGENDLHKNA